MNTLIRSPWRMCLSAAGLAVVLAAPGCVTSTEPTKSLTLEKPRSTGGVIFEETDVERLRSTLAGLEDQELAEAVAAQAATTDPARGDPEAMAVSDSAREDPAEPPTAVRPPGKLCTAS